jgi:hypothetical protein
MIPFQHPRGLPGQRGSAQGEPSDGNVCLSPAPSQLARGHLEEPARVDGGGTRLRIRALYAMGHSSARIARAARVDEQIVQRLARGRIRTVSPQLRTAVAAVYDTWWDKRPPERTPAERTAAVAARRRAIRGNWCAAAGLDDDLLDQPGYRPEASWRPATGIGIAADFYFKAAEPPREIFMSCDPRHSRALVSDVLAVLRQHGYLPRDPQHARRAERLVGDLARIYQGSQDAPTGAYVIAGPLPVSFTKPRRLLIDEGQQAAGPGAEETTTHD